MGKRKNHCSDNEISDDLTTGGNQEETEERQIWKKWKSRAPSTMEKSNCSRTPLRTTRDVKRNRRKNQGARRRAGLDGVSKDREVYCPQREF